MFNWKVGLDGSWTKSLAELVVVNILGISAIGSNNGSCELSSSLLSDCMGMI